VYSEQEGQPQLQHGMLVGIVEEALIRC